MKEYKNRWTKPLVNQPFIIPDGDTKGLPMGNCTIIHGFMHDVKIEPGKFRIGAASQAPHFNYNKKCEWKHEVAIIKDGKAQVLNFPKIKK